MIFLHSSWFPVDTHRLYQLKMLWTKIAQVELLEHVLLTPHPSPKLTLSEAELQTYNQILIFVDQILQSDTHPSLLEGLLVEERIDLRTD